MLKMLILPLIVSSLVTGLTKINSKASGKLCRAALAYYLSTTFIAVIIGIFLVMTIHPGSADQARVDRKKDSSDHAASLDAVFDIISQCFPENIVTAAFQKVVTKVFIVQSAPRFNETSNSTYTVGLEKPKLVTVDGINVLGIIVFSIALGCVLNSMGEEGKPVTALFESLNTATMVLISTVIWFTPVGILFLIASKFISTKDFSVAMSDLGMYTVVVLTGLAIHGIIVLPVLYFVFTRKNPGKFAFNMLKAFCTAWGTSSSSATLPVTMDCLINNNKVNINVVRFVVPVGATVNMDGTALYEAVACIFIAQVNGMDLSLTEVIIVSLTATAAAIGAASIPQAGLVTLIFVLSAVGLPADDITLILSIDWFLDRFRTVINVWGDCVGAGILNKYFEKDFELYEESVRVGSTVMRSSEINKLLGSEKKANVFAGIFDEQQKPVHELMDSKVDGHEYKLV